MLTGSKKRKDGWKENMVCSIEKTFSIKIEDGLTKKDSNAQTRKSGVLLYKLPIYAHIISQLQFKKDMGVYLQKRKLDEREDIRVFPYLHVLNGSLWKRKS